MKTNDMLTFDYMEEQNMMIKPKLQTHWGWLVVFYVFLAGLGGGTFLISFIMRFMDKFNDPARIGVFIGPIIVSIGALMLLLDLGSPARAFRLFTTPSTWMTSWLVRGAYILSIFIILGLTYALIPWAQESGLGRGLGMVAAIFSLLVLLEPPLLLAVNNSIPLWNTSALPALFFFSGLNTGLAVFVLLSSALPSTVGVNGFHLLANVNIAVLVILLVVLVSYLEIVRQTGQTAAASIRLMLSPLFTWGVIGAGILLPLAIFILCSTVSDGATIRVLETIAGILILIGGLLLRFGVVKSGLRLPVIS
jgi:formate-dependent nitrite reductase membrane component NrfD